MPVGHRRRSWVDTGLLKPLKVMEAIVSFGRQTEVWFPDGKDEACSVIGKFTQGSVADGKRLTRWLVIDQGELDLLVCDTRQSGTLVGAAHKCPPSVAINGALPRELGTGFAEVQEWEFEATCHPVIPAWFGRHFANAGWAPTPLLGGYWLAEASQSHGSDCLFRETD